MNFHSVLSQLAVWIVIFVPDESQYIPVLFLNYEGVEHLFNVCHKGHDVVPEAQQDA